MVFITLIFPKVHCINLSLTCGSEGNIPLNGTAIIHIVRHDGEQLTEFNHEICDLSSGRMLTFSDSWQIPENGDGMYKIVAYILSGSHYSASMSILKRMDFLWQK